MPTKNGRRDLGAGALYQRSTDGMWIGSVSLPAGVDGKRRRRYVSARNKAEASRKLRELRGELDRQGDLPTSSTTVARWLDTWLGIIKKDMRPNAWVTYQRQARYITAAIGKKRLDRLSASDVRRVTDYMTQDLGLSPTTAANVHGVLKQALMAARADGKTVPDATLAVKRLKRAPSTRGALSADEAKRLLKSSAEDPQAFVSWSLALVLGLRQGERLGITRDELDLKARTLDVSWQLQRLRWEHHCGVRQGLVWPCGYSRAAWCPKRRIDIPPHHEARHVVDALWLTRPKTDTGNRRVPLPEPVAIALERYLERTPPGMQGLILHREDGRPWEPDVDRAMWHTALQVAGLPSVPLHSARHTTASLLREMGVKEDVRMQILGHASPQVTAGYTHLGDAETVDAMRMLGELVMPQ